MRPETGSMEFEEDWAGIFIRGDHALWYAQQLALLRESLGDCNNVAEELENLLKKAYQHTIDNNRQYMKKYSECKK